MLTLYRVNAMLHEIIKTFSNFTLVAGTLSPDETMHYVYN